MSEQFQKPGGYKPRWIGLRMLACGAVGMLLALGLCAVGLKTQPGQSLGGVSTAGLYLLLASAFVFVAAVLVTIVEVIVAAVHKGRERSRRDEDR